MPAGGIETWSCNLSAIVEGAFSDGLEQGVFEVFGGNPELTELGISSVTVRVEFRFNRSNLKATESVEMDASKGVLPF